MSWDIHISDFPQVESIAGIPDDFAPAALGSRESLTDKIVEIFPSADFGDPSWGVIEGEGWSIEVNIGREAECDSIMLHVRGGDGAIAAVAAILNRLQLRAIDLQSGEFFDSRSASESFDSWRAYRDQVVAGYAKTEPGAKRPGFFAGLFGKKV
ncbi:hypothetical protein GCM10009087_13400 [Sphingomonas oligophenolica]|uniref:DUF3168 domain-containing protein n=1 Tax=Sphingomonas oligophenolica TaxID=301154 RepID=A0ABU9Y2H2_9SPHN